MSSHPNGVPVVDVWKHRDFGWTWHCWYCGAIYHQERTHAEAIEAALNHCKKANQP